jgi:MinD superfamily P-loop ATPase
LPGQCPEKRKLPFRQNHQDIFSFMHIAIASGKGGTGKTTVAANLAALTEGDETVYVDCDVEAPNGHLFLKPELSFSETAGIPVPQVDPALCTGCGKCVEVCRFNALACVAGKLIVFAELCHGCGGCVPACPEKALTESSHAIGTVSRGMAGDLHFVQGTLRVGAAMSPPLIRAVKAQAPDAAVIIYDAPPGTSCPVITTLKGMDYVVLVTEPTPFGLNDLQLAVETVRTLGLPFGVVINRADVGDARVRDYCDAEDIPVLLTLPEDRRIAAAYSGGALIVDALPEYRASFMELLGKIRDGAGQREKGKAVRS